jgi:hypothetical protein
VTISNGKHSTNRSNDVPAPAGSTQYGSTNSTGAVSTSRPNVQQNRPVSFTKGGRMVGATCAQTIRQSRDRSNGQPQERQHSAASWRDARPTAPGERHVIFANDRPTAVPQRCAFRNRRIDAAITRRNTRRPRRSQLIFRSAEILRYDLIAPIADFVSATMRRFERRRWQRLSRAPMTNSVGCVGSHINQACFQSRPVTYALRGFAAFAFYVATSTWRCWPYQNSDHSTGFPMRIWPYRSRTHMFGQMTPK